MHTKQIEDLFDITQNFQYVMELERLYFDTAKHLSNDYTGGQWESEALTQSWFFLLNTNKQFHIDDIQVNAKVFSYVINYVVLTNMINSLSEKGLMDDPLYFELYYIWTNLINSTQKTLNEEERLQYYRLID